jgi:hypothetical protein
MFPIRHPTQIFFFVKLLFNIMGIRPPDPDILSVHTYWDSSQGMNCPLCDQKLEHAFNDGGRIVVTLKGKLWVVSNYYRCLNSNCDLHKAFPMVHESVVKNKKFGKDIWERIVRYHFKTHLDYHQIQELLWDDNDISVSITAIRSMVEYFERAGTSYLDQKILQDIQTNGQMVVSLDGAQPKKGRPALWIFTDRITQHTIHAELLVSASAPVLVEKLKNLQEKFGVPIKAVISDKQKNIVNAIKEFNPDIPHAFCQYHFLNHIMAPIQAKDSHIATQIRKKIRSLSIITNLSKGFLNPTMDAYRAHYFIFAPLAEELLNAVAVNGHKWDIFPGKEMYENIQYVQRALEPFLEKHLKSGKLRTIKAVYRQLSQILDDYHGLYEEILDFLVDTADLRKIIAKKHVKSKTIKKSIQTWVYRMQGRLKRRRIEYKPQNLKDLACTFNTPVEQIWQQWIRLEYSYHEEIYFTYDFPDIESTNNATERLINQTKRHFKKWLGQHDISAVFERHSEAYAQLIELDYSHEQINEILWKQSVAVGENAATRFEYFQPILKRDWRIRTNKTRNFAQLEENFQI